MGFFSGITSALGNIAGDIGHGVSNIVKDIPGSAKTWENIGRGALALPTGGLSEARTGRQAGQIAGLDLALLGGATGNPLLAGAGAGTGSLLASGRTDPASLRRAALAGGLGAGGAYLLGGGGAPTGTPGYGIGPGAGTGLSMTAGGETGLSPDIARATTEAELAGALPASGFSTFVPSQTGLSTATADQVFNTQLGAALPSSTGVGAAAALPGMGIGGLAPEGTTGGVGLRAPAGGIPVDVHGDPLVGGATSAVGGTTDLTNVEQMFPTAAGAAPLTTAPATATEGGLGLKPPAGVGGATAPGTAGIGSILTGKNLAKFGLPAAYLGMALLNSRKALPGESAYQQEAGQFGAMGAADIANARAGVLQPWQQSQVNAFTQQQTASAKQMLTNLGMDPNASSSMLGLQQNIAQQADAIKNGYLQQTFSQGMSEMGIADAATQNYVQLQLARRQELSQALTMAMTTTAFMMMV